jgi:hypothetical protein
MAEHRRFAHPPVISESLAAELDQYHGRWVAIDEGTVVAFGDSVPDALARARERNVADPLVFYVPEHPDRPRF